MIALLFALPEESRDLLTRLRSGGGVDAGRHAPWVLGQWQGTQFLIGHSGMGPTSAKERARRLLEAHRPSIVVSTGFAGGLDPSLAKGALVLDVRGETGFHSLSAAFRHGSIVSQPALCASVAEKAHLWEATGALAVDMETAAIAAVCRKHSVPCVALRVISDPALEPVAVPLAYCYDLERQQPQVWALLRFLVMHPWRIPLFVRFVRGLAPVRAALTDELLALIENTPRTGAALPAA